MLKGSGIYPVEAFARAISTFQKSKIAEMNTKALSAGVELASAADAGIEKVTPA